MEGFILLIVLYFLFQAIVKRTKQAVQNSTEKPVAATTQKPRAVKTTLPKQPQPKSTPPSPPHSMMTVSAWEKSYQPIQPSLNMDTWKTAYTGSMGGTSQEGTVSREGMLSQEGSVSLEGETEQEYSQTTAANVHYGEQVPDSAVPVLPTEWDASALVQAVVSHEILKKPTQRWRS